jgi:hypothetical protein
MQGVDSIHSVPQRAKTPCQCLDITAVVTNAATVHVEAQQHLCRRRVQPQYDLDVLPRLSGPKLIWICFNMLNSNIDHVGCALHF